jgi:hypothetical protein
MQQAADQKRTQHVVTADAAAVAGVDEVERPALECKAGVGSAWAFLLSCGWKLLWEGRELLAGAFFMFLAFLASLAFRCFASFASLAVFSSFSRFISTILRETILCKMYVESNVKGGKRWGTHLSALGERNVDYLCVALLQLDAVVNVAITRVKERVFSGPLQKARLGERDARIVIAGSGWRGDTSMGCASM